MAKVKTTVPTSKVHYWKAPAVTDWDWPIRVAIAANTAGLVKKMREAYLAKTLTITKAVKANTGEFDILFIENDSVLPDLLLNKRMKVSASAVLVAIGEKNPEVSYPFLADKLKAKTKASAVIFFKTSMTLSDWYNRLVAELSHNRGIVTAIRTFNDKNTIVFTTKLIDRETQLSTYVKKWLNQLSGKLVTSKGKVWVHTKTGSIEMIIPEAIEFMTKNMSSLLYDYESRTATTVANIKKVTKKPSKKLVRRYPVTSGAAKKAVRKAKKAVPKAKKKTSSGGFDLRTPRKKLLLQKSLGKSRLRERSLPGFPERYRLPSPMLRKAAKKAAKKASPRPTARKSVKNRTPKPQKSYLLATFRMPRKTESEKSYLLPNSTYNLFVKIGKEDISFIKASAAISKEEVFTDPAVSQVTVSLEVRINTVKNVMTGRITWPRDNDSSMAKFPVTTGSKQRILEAEIIAYHKNRMLQKAVLQIEVRKPNSQPKLKDAIFKVEAVLRDRVDDAESGTEIDAAIITSSKPDSTKAMAGRYKSKPLPFKYTPQMQLVVGQIKTILESITLAATMPKKLNDAENIAVLYPLAIQGAKLYRYYLHSMPLSGPLQLINNSGDYLPIDFAYTRDAPSKGAKLCAHAEEALQQGKCNGCIKNKADERKYICPFGFWALSRVVERHEYTSNGGANVDYILKSVPNGKKTLNILSNALHGSSEKVDDAKKGLRKKVNEFVVSHCSRSTYAKNWKEWAKAVPGGPDSLILIVHVEQDPASTDNTMEIGADSLGQMELDNRYIPVSPGKNGPFVILIGCETTNTNLYLFDIVTELFLRGVSIVLSNITSIVADQAAAMVMELIAILKKQAGKTLSFGEVMLTLRQQLMAKGILAGLGLIAHGDSKWKIKV